MRFFQQQKISMAARYLRWQYEKSGQPVPGEAELQRQSAILVAEAQRIAGRTGKNVLGILKDLIHDLRKKPEP